MADIHVEDNGAAVDAEIRNWTDYQARAAENALEAVGALAVNYARSETGETQPPVKASEPPRPAHPGGWADVTGNLAGSYFYETGQIRARVFYLSIGAGQPYAEYLEDMGYWVVSGLFDGFVQQALRFEFSRAIR